MERAARCRRGRLAPRRLPRAPRSASRRSKARARSLPASAVSAGRRRRSQRLRAIRQRGGLLASKGGHDDEVAEANSFPSSDRSCVLEPRRGTESGVQSILVYGREGLNGNLHGLGRNQRRPDSDDLRIRRRAAHGGRDLGRIRSRIDAGEQRADARRFDQRSGANLIRWSVRGREVYHPELVERGKRTLHELARFSAINGDCIANDGRIGRGSRADLAAQFARSRIVEAAAALLEQIPSVRGC